MALEASHIRFALDVKEKFAITDECDYVVGTIYPDSRYVTKIDRYLTHPLKEYPTDQSFKKDNFRKGWFAHLWCDDIQYALVKDIFPEIAEGSTGEQNNEWIKRTALKILQDIDDANSFEITKYLDCFSKIQNPNGEDMEKMKLYYKTFHEIYKAPEKLTIDSYNFLWTQWGLDGELVKKLIAQTKLFALDENIMIRLKGLYARILEKAQ